MFFVGIFSAGSIDGDESYELQHFLSHQSPSKHENAGAFHKSHESYNMHVSCNIALISPHVAPLQDR